MGQKKTVASACLVLSVLTLLAGCGGRTTNSPYAGKWAYDYDTSKTALEIKDDGNAKLDDKKFTCTEKDGVLKLENSDGGSAFIKLKEDGDGAVLYKHTEYTSSDNDGIVGDWKSGNWTFQFTEKGTFLEDGYFPGYYAVDEEGRSLILIYSDRFDNTIIPFDLDGGTLYLDYPWDIVRRK